VDRLFHQPVDLKPPAGEPLLEQRPVLLSGGEGAVVPEVGEMSFSLYWPGVASTCSNSRGAG
jgi:hypothetical protein